MAQSASSQQHGEERQSVHVPATASTGGPIVLDVTLPNGLPPGSALVVTAEKDGSVIGSIRPFGGPAGPGSRYQIQVPASAVVRNPDGSESLDVRIKPVVPGQNDAAAHASGPIGAQLNILQR